MKPVILKDFPESDYHAQTGSDTPLFSYSVAKTINSKSAYHAWLEHPLLGNQPRESTKAVDKGSIIHGLLLGSGQEIVVIEADSFRTNAAKELRDLAYSEEKIPILEKDWTALIEGVETIKYNIKQLAPYFFEPHESELSVRWEMDNGVKCQSRFDFVQPKDGRLKIIDLKSTKDANPNELDRDIIKFGYDIQETMYMDCGAKTWPDMAGRIDWEFIFVEPEPPYMVSVIETDSSMSWLGEHKLQRSSDKWAECLKIKKGQPWPGYGRQIVSAPGWAVSKEEGE